MYSNSIIGLKVVPTYRYFGLKYILLGYMDPEGLDSRLP